jgi:protein SPA2
VSFDRRLVRSPLIEPLQPYLEAQTEAVVFAIQTVLSGVRSASTPSSALSENVTRIITIVSSIVAVCKDSFPVGSSARGEQLLTDLSDQANRLSEAIERGGELSKEDRQVVARSSFAVANAMKELVKL